MDLKQHFELLAAYNQWMNEKIYTAAGRLGDDTLRQETGAFFGSILNTLNHIVVGDTIWLKRFAQHPASSEVLSDVTMLPTPAALDQTLFPELAPLYNHRKWLDQKIIDWASCLTEADLNCVISYRNTKGITAQRVTSALILHFFNHQTHHRGQVSTLLSQAGEDIGVTDLLALIPETEYTGIVS
ncbi:DinB family protein [Microbulbifer aggregans]|uniref:DinB family protein n=1 Tax=Microbulbifer aggregans TaxID=1769779 RepID=UPI001CFCFD88|nr:DinB family protein [Microbulbifer aggregans]